MATKEINQSTTISQYPLERRKVYKKLLSSMISWTILFVILIVISIVVLLAMKWSILILIPLVILYIIIFFVDVWYQNEYFKRYYYNLESDFLVIKKGVIMPHETMLPYEKLQDVYMDQDLLDRIFNLWDVHVSTATAMSGYEAHIDGVNRENAETLRKLILDKIRKSR